MSVEFQTAKDIATHPATTGGGALVVISWLINKVWRGHRHEITSMKAATVNNADSIGELDKKLDAHAQRDEDSFRELQKTIAANHAELLTHLITLRGK